MKTRKFDVAEMLETEEDIHGFLQEVSETGTDADFIHALSTAARAVGMSVVAEKAGVTRSSLYKSLAVDGNPQFNTISKVTQALGCKLAVA